VSISLYIDEDSMDNDLVQALRLRGVDVTTVRDEGRRGLSDEEQLEFASANGRVLYTFNVKDYLPLHAMFPASERSHAGIIVAEQRNYSVGEQLRRLLRIIGERSAEQMRD